MVDWKNIVVPILIPIITGILTGSTIISFILTVFLTPNLTIDLESDTNNKHDVTITALNNGKSPALNLLFTIQTSEGIDNVTIFTTENYTRINNTDNIILNIISTTICSRRRLDNSNKYKR
jgi:hypothetical protein